ncbi:alpha/beta hydrolase family protein [Candidatus Latescibacterota bacterium]
MKRRDILKGSVVMSLGAISGNNVLGAVDENPFPPKKIIKKSPLRYSPLAYIEKETNNIKPKLTFTGSKIKDVEEWQKKLRAKLWDLIGEHHEPGKTEYPGKLLEEKTFTDYTLEKWEIEIVPGRSMSFYVLKPRSGQKVYKTVLCLHGHGNGARDIFNMPVNDEARELIGILNTDYAVQCVKRGWCAVAPELFAFGERVDMVEDARPGFDGGCEKPFLNAVQLGKTLIGIRAKDICTLIDWMSTRSEFDLTDLACVGLSGGGMMTMYTAALDDRIRRALISGYITEAKDSILAIRHCSCNYIPELARWADFPDIAGLIAPRFLIVQSGRKDAIFPIESARRAFAKISDVYKVFNKQDNILFHEHDGYHSFWSPSLDDLL